MTPIERFRFALEQAGSRKQGATGWTCPAHDDRRASLSFKEGRDSRVLVTCHAGCDLLDILHALNLDQTDLFPPKEHTNGSRPQITATYDYTNEDGHLLFQAVRYFPKDFRQRRRPRPDDPQDKIRDGWVWNLQDTRRVLYRLPSVLAAVGAGRTLWVVEGERDVHALEDQGVVATCNPMGAGKWRHEFAQALQGATVTVVADLDDPGRAHAETVAKSLRNAGCTVRVVAPAKGKDAADHLRAGLDLDDFQPLAPPGSSEGTPDRPSEPQADTTEAPRQGRPFATVNLADLAAAGVPRPELLCDDLLYRGGLHSLAGPPDAGKSTILYFWMVVLLAAGHACVLLDEESGREATTEKLLGLGATPAHLGRLAYVEYPTRRWDADDVTGFADLLSETRPALVGFDSSAAFLAQAGRDENSAVDVTGFYKNVLLHAARTYRTAVVILDHLGKDQNGGRYARGSGAKLANVDVAYMLDPVKHFSRSQSGLLKLIVAKDRRGYLHRSHEVRVEVEDGQMTINTTKVEARRNGGETGESLHPAAEKLLAVLKAAGEPLTWSQIVDGVKQRWGHGLHRTTASTMLNLLAEHGLIDGEVSIDSNKKKW